MILLASRLDAVVYSLGLARTRRQARQLVGHGHVEVDGRGVYSKAHSNWSRRVDYSLKYYHKPLQRQLDTGTW